MELISKKELLAQTGISYGQLYRWKRERLIPEEWFIKQSSYTGQETFFPRQQVIDRVQAIMRMKDSHSLEEVAEFLNTQDRFEIDVESALAIEGVQRRVPQLICTLTGRDRFTPAELALVNEICRYADCSGLPCDVFSELLSEMLRLLASNAVYDLICTLFRHSGGYHIVFTKGATAPVFDRGVEVCLSFALGERINFYKARLVAIGGQEKGDQHGNSEN